MEEVLIWVLGFLFEVLMESLTWLPYDWWEARRPSSRLPGGERDSLFARALMALLVGVLLGWVSLWPFPHAFLHSATARIAHLVLAPCTAATLAALLNLWGLDWSRARAAERTAGARAWQAFWLTLGVVGARFVGVGHG